MVDIDADAVKAVVDEIEGAGGKAVGIVSDLTKDEDSRRIVTETANAFGGLDFMWDHVGHPGPASIEGIEMKDFDTAVDLEPSNVASREILDRRTPSSELCMSNGASAMVFDQRVFLSLNPFNVYVAQPEVKPGCVLRRSNWGVLERGNVVDKKTEDVCKQHLNTFAFVGDLDKSPEVSCVYHSEDAENQFMKDPTKAVLGDGVVQSMRERVDAQSDMKAFR